MFLHNFKKSLKILFNNRPLIFWTFAFPLIMATLFNMAFSNIENNEKLKRIDIGIVNDETFEENLIYSYAFDKLGDKNSDDSLFNITYDSKEKLDESLKDGLIDGYLYLDEEPHIVIQKNGINQSVFKYVTDEIEMVSKTFETVEFSTLDDVTKLISSKANIKDTTNANLSYTMIEFYSLVAMTCLYGAMLTMYLINQMLPNMTNKGKRIAVSSISKFKLIISNLCASYLVQFLGLALLFLYTFLVLNVNYGNNFLLVLLTSLVGSLAGLSFGMVVSCVFKGKENTKIGIIISITMVFSYMSGMMGITTKYLIDKNIPLLNKINPVNMITDALYSLYYYKTFDRFYFNIISLLIFSVILIFISFFTLRRRKYDSI